LAGIPNLEPPPSSIDPFASPDRLDPELQAFLEGACFRLCHWMARSSQGRPLPEIGQYSDFELSDKGLSVEKLLDEVQVIMNGAYKPSHPGSLAHLDPPPLTASIVGELISAGLNNNLLAEELSPSLSQLERKLCQWFSQSLGMSSDAGGVFASGGSLSNLIALVAAREHFGLQCDSSAVMFASSDAHVSLIKARRVMGLGEDSLQLIPTDCAGKIRLDLLQEKITFMKSIGRKCFAIVATAGTTVLGSVDPISDLVKISKKEGLWLHVDGAIGGIFALSPFTSKIVKGISSADSVTLNPQKILGIAKTSSLLIVSKRSILFDTFSTGLPYLDPPYGEPHGGEMGIQGTRSGEALKLWLGLRQLGKDGVNDLLKKAIERREYLQKKFLNSKFNLKAGDLHIISLSPKNMDEENLEKWSKNTQRDLLYMNYMVSRPIYNGSYYLKMVLGNPNTSLNHLDELAEIINQSVT